MCVIDRSGSMSGDKLRLCKETLNFTIKQLHSKDRLAVVAYDNTVTTPLDLCYMDSRGKELVSTAVLYLLIFRQQEQYKKLSVVDLQTCALDF